MYSIVASILTVAMAAFSPSSDEPTSCEFAIFCVIEHWSPHGPNLPLGQLTLAEDPLIAQSDIISYDWDNHILQIGPRSFSEVCDRFVVSVCGEPVYLGSITRIPPLLSSTVSSRPTIYIPDQSVDGPVERLRIALQVNTHGDSRFDKRVFDALAEAGLVEK